MQLPRISPQLVGRGIAGGALLLAGLAVAGLATLLFGRPKTASAHCDSANGPVANAAQRALEQGDVKLVLPYVKEAEEAELTAAFGQAVKVRAAGGARALADRYFAETAVRLHRQGEDASYTGLKEGGELPPALDAAEHALESGALAEVYDVLDKEVRAGIEERYHAVIEARKAEAKKATVENARARVEAEFDFERYILGISDSTKATGHAEEAAPAHRPFARVACGKRRTESRRPAPRSAASSPGRPATLPRRIRRPSVAFKVLPVRPRAGKLRPPSPPHP